MTTWHIHGPSDDGGTECKTSGSEAKMRSSLAVMLADGKDAWLVDPNGYRHDESAEAITHNANNCRRRVNEDCATPDYTSELIAALEGCLPVLDDARRYLYGDEKRAARQQHAAVSALLLRVKGAA